MSALQPLLEKLNETSGPMLWLADESNAPALPSLAVHRDRLIVISNRFDIVQTAQSLGINAQFSDFNFSFLPILAQQPQTVFYRVSKERPVVNHILNQLHQRLPVTAKIWLAGHKNEGIKTYFSQASQLFGCSHKLKKQGSTYWGLLEKSSAAGEPLDDKRYSQLRLIEPEPGEIFYTKPGTYGWDKIDKGSAFLAAQLPHLLAGLDTAALRLLDLGCGYGYLTLQTARLGLKQITATDNNAAALACAQANIDHFGLAATLVADDCAARLTGPFDIIVCNPPFHQGFSVEGALTDKFLANTQRLLTRGGRAFFVVNGFIPLETKATSYFDKRAVTSVANNGQFKVVELRKF